MIALITATWDEIRLLKRDIQVSEDGTSADFEFVLGNLYGKSVIIAESGVGIKKVRTGVSYIIQKFKPSLILIAGFGGALSSELKVGDIVLGEEVFSLMKNEVLELRSDISLPNGKYKKGRILTESRFISEPDEKIRLSEESKSLVVDMETWGVAEAARQSRTPVMSIRAVSDKADESLPDMASIYNSSGEFDFEKADSYFKENPHLITPYLKFRYTNTPAASNSLYLFLKEFIVNHQY